MVTAEKCSVCTRRIRVMCFKGTGVCGELCRKARDGEPVEPKAIAP